jgi:hypothetical protein
MYGGSDFGRELVTRAHISREPCDILMAMPRRMSEKRGAGLSDAEVRAILVQSMADAGYDPAFVYAFRKTGVYVCDENENRLPENSLKAFDAALDEYFAAIGRPAQ